MLIALVVFLGILLLSIIIFFLTFIVRVKSNFVYIIEVLGEFYKQLPKGIYFLNPFKYRVVAMISLEEKTVKGEFNNLIFGLTYQIVDPKENYYNKNSFTETLTTYLDSLNSLEELDSKELDTVAKQFGIKIIQMKGENK